MNQAPAAASAAAPVLRWREQFRTRSADEAVETVEQLYGPHSIALGRHRDLDMQLAGFDVGQLTVNSIEYGCAVTAHTEILHDYWVFSFCARGEIRVGGHIAQAGYAGTRAPHEMGAIPMSPELRLLNIKVPSRALADAQRTLFGEEGMQPIAYAPLVAPGTAPARHIVDLMERLNALPVCDSPHAPLLERRWQEAALLELLMMWPSSVSQRLHAAPGGAVERAMAFIQHDPGAHLTLADVARAAGVGIRALTRAFEKRLGVSPMRYVQQCRLERAHADLQDGRGSVTEIAYRWGFGNLGDFAVRYRERYGRKPSETLRR